MGCFHNCQLGAGSCERPASRVDDANEPPGGETSAADADPPKKKHGKRKHRHEQHSAWLASLYRVAGPLGPPPELRVGHPALLAGDDGLWSRVDVVNHLPDGYPGQAGAATSPAQPLTSMVSRRRHYSGVGQGTNKEGEGL